jgi:hypothetical protein
VGDEPCREVSCESEFKEDSEDSCREEGSRYCGPRICEDGAVTESAFCSCGWVVRWGYWAQKEEGDSVRDDKSEGCEDEGCRADGVERM